MADERACLAEALVACASLRGNTAAASSLISDISVWQRRPEGFLSAPSVVQSLRDSDRHEGTPEFVVALQDLLDGRDHHPLTQN